MANSTIVVCPKHKDGTASPVGPAMLIRCVACMECIWVPSGILKALGYGPLDFVWGMPDDLILLCEQCEDARQGWKEILVIPGNATL